MEATIKDLKLELWLRKRNNDDIIWTTKQGDNLSIRLMSDSHLINAINFLERQDETEGPDIGDLVNIEECGDR